MPNNYGRESYDEFRARLKDPKLSFDRRFALNLRHLEGMVSPDKNPLFPTVFASSQAERQFMDQVFKPAEVIANDYLAETEDDYDRMTPAEYLIRLYMFDPWEHGDTIRQAYEEQATKEQI